MDDVGKITRAIRLNTAAGVAMLGIVALAVGLVAVGVLQWESSMAMPMAVGAASGVFALLTAWSLRRDRDDPAGIERRERRLEAGVVVWGAALLLVALLAVGVIIVWGLAGSPG